jgi:hypothetical protein
MCCLAFSSLILNMKPETLDAVAMPLRMAIWNWVEHFPNELNECVRNRGRLENAPERCLESFLNRCQPGQEYMLWPTMSMLNTISTTNASLEFPQNKRSTKMSKFVEGLRRGAVSQNMKMVETTMLCALDFCRAGMSIMPGDEVPMKELAGDLAHELHVRGAHYTDL